jgi:hypothetical protein
MFDDELAAADPDDWAIAPAELDGDPANLFAHFPVYVRSAMTLQGYREIIGPTAFAAFAKRLQDEYAYDNISTEEFVDEALAESGFSGTQLDLLEQYFDEWLYGETQPNVMPDAF